MPLYSYQQQQQHAPTPRTTPGPGPYHSHFSTGDSSSDSCQYFYTPPTATSQPGQLSPNLSSTRSAVPPTSEMSEGGRPEKATVLLHAALATSSASGPVGAHPTTTAEENSTTPKHAGGESDDAMADVVSLYTHVNADDENVNINAESDAVRGNDVAGGAPAVHVDADSDTVVVAVKNEGIIDLSDS